MSEIWDTEQLAKAAGLTDMTVRYHLQQGHLPGAFKVRRDWAIPDEAARVWLRERGVEVEDEEDEEDT